MKQIQLLLTGMLFCGILVTGNLKAQSAQYSTLYNEAMEMIGKQKFLEASQKLDQAIRLKPNYKEAFMARGQCFLMLEQRDKACADFTESVRQGWKPAQDYLKKYCGADSPGLKAKPVKPSSQGEKQK